LLCRSYTQRQSFAVRNDASCCIKMDEAPNAPHPKSI
jgi:hypothetical protein